MASPAEAERNRLKTHRAIGKDGLLAMEVKRARCDYETKAAAARAVIDVGMSKPEVIECFKIASESPLKSRCRLYRKGGTEAMWHKWRT